MNDQPSRERARAARFGRSLWWAFVLSFQMFAYLAGIALIATLTHGLALLLERVNVPGDALDIGRWVVWSVEFVTGMLLAIEAVVREYQATRDRLKGESP